MKRIATIGAGLSGLTVANRLKKYANVTVFEKSRGAGGRMATRRADPYAFDHGAQFFKARTEAFKQFIAPLVEQGVIDRWDARFVEIVNGTINLTRQWNDEDPHYVGVPSMSAVGRYLMQDLPVCLNTRIEAIEKRGEQWSILGDKGRELGLYDWVILAVPAAQAEALLPKSSLLLPQVSQVAMSSCFSLMLAQEHAIPLEYDAALVRGADISWISVNSSKPGRTDPFCLLVHATNRWADAHIDDDRQDVMEYLINQTSESIGHDVSQFSHQAIHGWRYANIGKQGNTTHLLDPSDKIALCGDWLRQGRVEAAFTSGLSLAEEMLNLIN